LELLLAESRVICPERKGGKGKKRIWSHGEGGQEYLFTTTGEKKNQEKGNCCRDVLAHQEKLSMRKEKDGEGEESYLNGGLSKTGKFLVNGDASWTIYRVPGNGFSGSGVTNVMVYSTMEPHVEKRSTLLGEGVLRSFGLMSRGSSHNGRKARHAVLLSV